MRWWKWFLSAPAIGWRYLRRFAITNDVSRIGTSSTSSGKTSESAAAVFITPWIDTQASRKPSASEPESPMNTRAGWKFQRRKPMQAPQIAAASVAEAIRSSDSARTTNVPDAIAQMPAARPSMPSAKLTMFATATMKTIVTG